MRAFVTAMFLLTSAPASAQVWFGLPTGFFGPYDNNEIRVVAQDDDPAKVRGSVAEEALIGTNLFGLSANIMRRDFRDEEYGLFMFRLAPNRKEGAFYIALRPEAQSEVREVVYGDTHGMHFSVPIFAPNLGGTSQAGAVYSVDQNYLLAVQGDGNLVHYQRVGTTWCPRWHSWGGVVPKEAWPVTGPNSECRK